LDDDVYAIKRQLAKKASKGGLSVAAPGDLVLTSNGKVWRDAGVLDDYCLHSSSSASSAMTVHVSCRRGGGCFMVSLSVLCVICAAVVGTPCTCGLSLLVVPVLLPLLMILPFFCL
jgi:hypothetical protein